MNITLHASTVRTLRDRGGTWALYQNQALDSGSAGQVVCMRYGPDATLAEASEQMPDTPQYGPGWKYRLVARVEASCLPDVADSDDEIDILPSHAPAAEGGP